VAYQGLFCCYGEEMSAVKGGEKAVLLLVVGSGVVDSMK
jgi:hypothetical protein